jgi:hypothetical protein
MLHSSNNLEPLLISYNLFGYGKASGHTATWAANRLRSNQATIPRVVDILAGVKVPRSQRGTYYYAPAFALSKYIDVLVFAVTHESRVTRPLHVKYSFCHCVTVPFAMANLEAQSECYEKLLSTTTNEASNWRWRKKAQFGDAPLARKRDSFASRGAYGNG